MSVFGKLSRRTGVAVLAAGAIALGGLGIAIASSTQAPPSNAVHNGRGINEFGMTGSYIKGKFVRFTYTKGFYCDTRVSSAASSKCEAGANYKTPPAKNFDPLYITVPLGFTPMHMQQCPAGLVCVDHPGTIDLSRLEPALKPLYPTLTDKQLTAALKNYAVPAHDHFITTLNGRKAEWWDVKVVGVTSPSVFKSIAKHGSFGYIKYLINYKNKNVVGPIDTNLFLYFAAK